MVSIVVLTQPYSAFPFDWKAWGMFPAGSEKAPCTRAISVLWFSWGNGKRMPCLLRLLEVDWPVRRFHGLAKGCSILRMPHELFLVHAGIPDDLPQEPPPYVLPWMDGHHRRPPVRVAHDHVASPLPGHLKAKGPQGTQYLAGGEERDLSTGPPQGEALPPHGRVGGLVKT